MKINRIWGSKRRIGVALQNRPFSVQKRILLRHESDSFKIVRHTAAFLLILLGEETMPFYTIFNGLSGMEKGIPN